jgi:hypothetical protein
MYVDAFDSSSDELNIVQKCLNVLITSGKAFNCEQRNNLEKCRYFSRSCYVTVFHTKPRTRIEVKLMMELSSIDD